MRNLVLASVSCLLLAQSALAQGPAAKDEAAASGATKTTQQNRMKECNKEAKGKKGAERKTFMKGCLSTKKHSAD